MSVGSEAPSDLNLALIIYYDSVGQLISYVHSESTSFNVGDHECVLMILLVATTLSTLVFLMLHSPELVWILVRSSGLCYTFFVTDGEW